MNVEVGEHTDLVSVAGQLHEVDPAGKLFLIPLADATIVGTIGVTMPVPATAAGTIRLALQAAAQLMAAGWEATGVIVAAYGPAPVADPLLDLLQPMLPALAGLVLYDVLRVDEGRCWSYLCPGEECGRGGPGMPVDPWCDAAIQLATVLGAEGLHE